MTLMQEHPKFWPIARVTNMRALALLTLLSVAGSLGKLLIDKSKGQGVARTTSRTSLLGQPPPFAAEQQDQGPAGRRCGRTSREAATSAVEPGDGSADR